MIDVNSYTYHRKFDGKLQYIDFKLRKRDDNEDMIDKIHNVLAFGDVDKFIDEEDKNGKEDVIEGNELENEDIEDDEELVPKPDDDEEPSELIPSHINNLD